MSTYLPKSTSFVPAGTDLGVKLLRLVSLMPAVQDAVAVEGVDVGVGSPKEMNQVHYQVKGVKSGPARTSKVISLPSALATRARMEICSALPWRRWPHTLG